MLVHGFAATFAFALLAGAGTAVFNPTVMAALPSLVARERLPAATSLYGTVDELGYVAGPLLAGAALVAVGPSAVLLANAVTFAASSLLLASLRFGSERERAPERSPLLASARAGLDVVRRTPGTRALLFSSTACVAFLGMVNVGELVLAREVLHTTDTGFAVLVTVMGLGVAAGTLTGAGGGAVSTLRRRYLLGLLTVAAGLLLCGLAPSLAVALPAFALLGVGNGAALAHELLLLQSTLADDVLGRVFGLRSSLVALAFLSAFLLAGGAAATLGARPLFVLAAGGAFAAWAAASLALRDHSSRGEDSRAAGTADAAAVA